MSYLYANTNPRKKKDLQSEEKAVLDAYRRLDEVAQAEIRGELKGLLKRNL
ncbi:hypothetical protein I3300191I4_10550 [Megasphaera elsdenii]